MNDNDLIPLLRLLNRDAGRTWKCPDDAQLSAYADNRLAGNQRQRVEEHLADCQHCANQVVFLVGMQKAEAPDEVPGPLVARARALAGAEPRRVAIAAYRWGALAAAAACLAVVTTFWLRQPPVVLAPSAPPVFRSPKVPAQAPQTAPSARPATPAAREGAEGSRRVRNAGQGPLALEPLFPRPDSLIARGDLEFRWKEVPGSLFYEVRLVTAEGNLVWEGRGARGPLPLPNDVTLEAGQKYFVWIRAHLPEGKTVQSRAIGFQIRP